MNDSTSPPDFAAGVLENYDGTPDGITSYMEDVAAARRDGFLAATSRHLSAILDDHGPGSDGQCQSCGLGDSSWPCPSYLSAQELAIQWLFVEAAR